MKKKITGVRTNERIGHCGQLTTMKYQSINKTKNNNKNK